MKLPDKLYDVLKWLCLIALPALATFYGVIAKIWGLPYGAEIVTTITAVATLIGALIGVSTIAHNKESEGGEDDGEAI
ncbi:MAG: phage holin [Eubacterium sp.]|jgi:hypothetical protein|nr:phage holin [Eubacterium sp.]